jgi:hypothetical protein
MLFIGYDKATIDKVLSPPKTKTKYHSFQTFTVFCMLYVFFWVIPRCLNFICRRFGTLYLFHLHKPKNMEQIDCSETSAYKIQTPGNYTEENTTKSHRHILSTNIGNKDGRGEFQKQARFFLKMYC